MGPIEEPKEPMAEGGAPNDNESLLFRDRTEAGKKLAERLGGFRSQDPVVLGLPRGGLPVAAMVAEALSCPLDIIVSRKIGYPGNPELAIGAVTARGTRVLHDELLRMAILPPGYLEDATAAARKLAQDREEQFRQVGAMVPLEGKTALVVDDGVATGMTMLAAVEDARAQKPARVVVAAPVIAPSTVERLRQVADEVVYLGAPAAFFAIGQFYEDFSQVSDDQVRDILAESRRVRGPGRLAR